jgi:hypothetical protein
LRQLGHKGGENHPKLVKRALAKLIEQNAVNERYMSRQGAGLSASSYLLLCAIQGMGEEGIGDFMNNPGQE